MDMSSHLSALYIYRVYIYRVYIYIYIYIHIYICICLFNKHELGVYWHLNFSCVCCNMAQQSIYFLDVTLDRNDVRKDAFRVLLEIRPHWNEATVEVEVSSIPHYGKARKITSKLQYEISVYI